MPRTNSISAGFTLIELLVVIAIIGVLSTVALTSFNAARARARDTQRLSDVAEIVKALEIYKTDHGFYPQHYPAAGDWEMSWENGGNFLHVLRDEGYFPAGVPVDPRNSTTYYYGYYRYPAGSSGCDAASGDYYVLVIRDLETSTRPYARSVGWDCPDRHNWVTSYDWVMGSYTK